MGECPGVGVYVERGVVNKLTSMLDDEKRPPACPNCGKPMHLDRLAASVLGYPELRTYTCPSCWGDVAVLPDAASREDDR